MNTLNELLAENEQLRSQLEAARPACTARVIAAKSGDRMPTLDAVFAEHGALKAIQAGVAAQQSVQSRGADVLASYTQPNATTAKVGRDLLQAGKVSAKKLSLASEIKRLEALARDAKGKTKVCLEKNLADAKAALAKLAMLVAITVALFATARAQDLGPFTIRTASGAFVNGSDGTNCAVAPLSTNTFLGADVSDSDIAGFRISLKADGPATTAVQVYGYRSIDGTYETAPSLTRTITFNGTTRVETVIEQSLPSAALFKLQIGNTNASIAVTNLQITRRFKAPARTFSR